MKLVIEIVCDNAAFCNDLNPDFWRFEASSILHAVASRIDPESFGGDVEFPIPLIDKNGNRVGLAHINSRASRVPR